MFGVSIHKSNGSHFSFMEIICKGKRKLLNFNMNSFARVDMARPMLEESYGFLPQPMDPMRLQEVRRIHSDELCLPSPTWLYRSWRCMLSETLLFSLQGDVLVSSEVQRKKQCKLMQPQGCRLEGSLGRT